MSADNGIYILSTPARPIKQDNTYIYQRGTLEYRVAYCSAIDNIDYSDLYLPLYFGDSKIFKSWDNAYAYALKLRDDFDYLEYGICNIHRDIYFPNITAKAAEKALDCYVGATPLDYKD